tara:strand:- start:173 stop:661 length:489 start_codon:yes stop_codon:yes gene_type:complete
MTTNKTYFPYEPGVATGLPLKWGDYLAGTIPDVGNTHAIADQWETPTLFAQMAAPCNCTLVAIAISCSQAASPSAGFTNFRIAAMSGDFVNQSPSADPSTWKTLGIWTSTTVPDLAEGYSHKGVEYCNADILAGETIGLVMQTVGGSSGVIHGSATLAFRRK